MCESLCKKYIKYTNPNRTGAYTKKIVPSAPHKSPKSRENLLFPDSGAYTEKMSCQIHFFVVSGAQGDDFFTYAPFPPQNRVNREDIMDKWGTVEHFFCICPTYPRSGIKILTLCARNTIKGNQAGQELCPPGSLAAYQHKRQVFFQA